MTRRAAAAGIARRVRTLLPLAGLLAVASAAAEPATYALTPTHSFVHLAWPHDGLSTLRGRFDRLRGTFTLDRAAGRGSGRFVLRLDSLNTGRPALDAALRRALDTERQAELPLQLATLRFDGDRPTAAELSFSWQARAHTLVLQVERFNCYPSPLLLREICGGDLVGTLDLDALGVQLDPAWGLAARLQLQVQIEAVQQAAEP